jgi:hypothetical protein
MESFLKKLKENSTTIESNTNLKKEYTITTRPRSKTCPSLSASLSNRRYELGSHVLIVHTENVQQRLPQYIGKVGIIVEIPGMFLS